MSNHRRILRMRALADQWDGAASEALGEACNRLLEMADAQPAAAAPEAQAMSAESHRATDLAHRLGQQVWQDGRLALEPHEAHVLRWLDPQAAARLFEAALLQWPAAAAEVAARDAQAERMTRSLRQLALLLPPNLPLQLGHILRRRIVVEEMPRPLLAWALARAGVEHVSRWAERVLARPASHWNDRPFWVHDIVMQIDALPSPVFDLVPLEATQVADWVGVDNIAELAETRSEELSRWSTDGQHRATSAATPGRRRRTRAMPPREESSPPAAADGPAPEPAPDEFHFVLEGEHVQGASMREHTQADLHFRYEVPPADALARVDHPALESARQADLDISLQLMPCGAVSVVGDRRRVATLRGGRLTSAVSFRLEAGSAPDASDTVSDRDGVHVDFVVGGVSVHQLMLVIAVRPASAHGLLEAGSSPAAPVPVSVGAGPIVFDAALAASPPATHHVRLSLSVAAGGLHVEMDHVMAGTEQWSDLTDMATMDRAALAATAQLVRAPLARCYAVQAQAWQRFDGVVTSGDVPLEGALAQAMECVASCGSALNQALRKDPGMARMLDYIEALPQGTALTVTTDDIFLPWELLTTQPWSLNMSPAQRAAAGRVDTSRFWGARFAIETKPRGVPVGKRQNVHRNAAPRRVSVNLNPQIKMPGQPDEKQPLELHKAWARQLADRGQLDGNPRVDCLGMREVLQDAQHQASLVYLYCHGRSSNPFGGVDELLELDEECALSPSDLITKELVPPSSAGASRPEPTYGSASLVFLNACQSGQISPLGYSSFLKEFCKRGAIGLIATTHAVPITFGAHFGPELVDRYLDCHGPLAQTLRVLRGEHLGRGNPVPLFYTLQAQLDLPAAPSIGGPP